MLARLSENVFDDPDWVYEKKLDGYRALAYISAKGEAKLISRNGINFSEKYVQVVDALKELGIDAVLDGELVVEDKNGKSYFQQLQNYGASAKKMILKFYVFDMLALNGHDIRDLELVKRKELLEKVLEGLKHPLIIYNEHVAGSGKELYQKAGDAGWEGVIAKKANSSYLSDRRSDNWLKFKFQNSQEALILGFLSPEGGRHYFSSLALGMYEGTELIYIGNCGTGFNDQRLKEVFDLMVPLETSHKPVKQKIHKEQHVTWIKPKLVCEVIYSEWTADGHLRHPVFKGLRIYKLN
jgi:bifunctional non-homologous end joining protein LigD